MGRIVVRNTGGYQSKGHRNQNGYHKFPASVEWGDANQETSRNYRLPNQREYQCLDYTFELTGFGMRCERIEYGRSHKSWQKKYKYADYFTGYPIHARCTPATA